ncbi:abc transporter [Leptolyngbya sp. Heron Island J]|uniref:GldG family protein n=1 Tax=Leptolyngbya sp. Heron Island J TaxID=1385935 RepID=UPI0003B9E9DF|nr:Gldg family protein [Leptolyngbya sp. Heron Island J]ESA36795.1 abc transporter [Leptolyngbya sp. Heron Island J]
MKALSTSRKYLRWLIWPGLALTTAGLVAGFVDSWSVLPIVLLALGLVLTLSSLILGGFGYRSFWQSRSTQAGTNAILATVSVLLILGIINFLAVQYGPRLDLTEGGLFTLSPESISVVRNLDQPVKVVIFDSALNPNDRQLLESYQKLSNQLTYEHINPIQDPTAAREFNLSGEGREVQLEVGDRKIFVQPLGAQGLNEQDLTNKLAQVGRDRNAVVYFLQGHEEFVIDGSATGYAQAAAALEADNFTVESLNLDQTATVPDDANAVVIAGPKQAFFAPEVAALEAYLNQGGSVLLMVDPQTDPELDALLADWGVSLDEQLIVDASETGRLVGLGPATPLVTTYGQHPITEALSNGRSFYPLARPVLIEPVAGVEATPLLLSNAQSYAETLTDTGELNVDTQEAPEGPFNIGVALTKAVEASPEETATETSTEETSPEETSPEETSANQAEIELQENTLDTNIAAPEDTAPEVQNEAASAEQQPLDNSSENTEDAAAADGKARLVVIGNATFATDGLFDQQLNGDVFLNSVTWLSNLDDAILSIRPKEITNRRITMTNSRQVLVIVLALLVFPILGLGGASITWFRRR